MCFVIEFIIKKPIFGQSLQEHLDSDNREIAYVLEECISVLHEFAMEEEVKHSHIIFSLLWLQLVVLNEYIYINIKVKVAT